MTVSMISCPSCRTMLFSDTIVCPECGHVLDAKRAALIGDEENLAKSRSEQVPCRSCGEANQIGLVRCWNCSSFLREDIQEAYYEMLRGQREVIYSQPGNNLQESDARSSNSARYDADDDEDDFELSEAYNLSNSPENLEESPGYALSQPPPAASNGSEPHSPTTDPSAGTEQDRSKADPNPESPEAEAAKTSRARHEEDPNAEAHSVATGGDVLLDIAMKEEAEAEKRRKQRESQVQRKQKQQSTQKSSAPASPERLAAQKKALARQKAAKKRAAAEKRKAEQKFPVWITDVRQHTINPQKLKLKPGSVEKLFEPVDVGCSATGVIVVGLTKKPAMTLFSRPKNNADETRKEVREHLEADKAKKDLPAPKHEFFEGDVLTQIKVVQPVVYVHESMFAGVPIFGEGRIAVRLPQSSNPAQQHFLSFWLTDFRKFAGALEKLLQIKDLGLLEGVPLTDPILDLKCHYSENPIQALDPDAVKFYASDPNLKLKLVGRRCESCGLVISEDSRRKEKIGGLNGKSIARAKCPKCEKKFGSLSLFQLEEAGTKATEKELAEAK